MVRRFGKVAVLYGGMNAEREVSLNSGKNVLEALLGRGVDAHGIDVKEDIIEVLWKGQFDRAFNVLHGPKGEDGAMQALLDFCDIPYCGSGVSASALAMDKVRCKWVWQANDIPTPDFMLVKSELDLEQVKKRFHYPICIKPVHQGSSIGVSKVKEESQLLPAYQLARQYHDDVMAEQWIEGGEYTVGILNEQAFPAVKIVPAREFYDYQAKYLEKTTTYLCPSDLTVEEDQKLGRLALRAFRLLGCQGWGRVDFMRDKAGNFWAIEVNPQPGMTNTSLLPKAAKASGIEFSDLVVAILETSLIK